MTLCACFSSDGGLESELTLSGRAAFLAPEPAFNEDRSVAVVLSGNFYGYPLLRLELSSHAFVGFSPAELVCHLYEEHGLDLVQKLNGELSLVLWDEARQRMLAVRDRFGLEPLHYATSGGRLWITSEARQLWAAGVSREWDEASFYRACTTGYVPADGSLFRRVSQLPAGCFLVAEPGTTRTERYWEQPPTSDDAPRDPVGAFGAALDEAIRCRLPVGSPPAFQLNGDLGTGAVVALAAQALDPFEAFIVSHDESEEVAQARQLAELWGVQLRVLRPDVEAVLDAVIDGQRLVHDLGTSAQLLLSRGIEAAGYSVVLTGDGAEELLFGPDHLGQMQSWDEPTLAGVQRLLGFVPGFMRSGAILGQRLRSVMHPDFLASQENCDPFFEMTQALALDGLEPLEQSSRLLARLVERKAIQGARCPYYDYRLVELVSRLPMRFKVRGSVRQYVLREAVAPLIPRSLYVSEGPARLRFGFGRALVDRLRGLSLGREHPFIDRSRLLSRLDQLEREDRPEWESALLWLLSAYSLA